VKKLVVLFVISLLIMVLPAVADAKNVTIDLTEELDEKCTFYDIQSALDASRDDEDNYYTIIVPEGTYKLHGTERLRIYSNTTLDLTDVIIKRTADSEMGAMITVANPRAETGKSASPAGGYTKGGYTRGYNMKIIGGTFDSGTWYGDAYSTLCTFSHVKNMTFDGTTFIYRPKKTDNAHMIEFGAAKDITIKNCTFIGNQKLGEAVQIESAIKGVAGSDLMGRLDGTKTKNVKLINNRFIDFQYAFGTNHGCTKDLYTGFVIKDNRFEKITKYAICAYNYKKAVIKGNVISKSTRKSFDAFILKLGQKNTFVQSKNKVK